MKTEAKKEKKSIPNTIRSVPGRVGVLISCCCVLACVLIEGESEQRLEKPENGSPSFLPSAGVDKESLITTRRAVESTPETLLRSLLVHVRGVVQKDPLIFRQQQQEESFPS